MVTENSNSFRSLANKWGGGALNWMQNNPGKTASIAGGLAALLNMNSDSGASKVLTPLVTSGIVYALLKGVPMVQNANNFIGNANYATLEARALMAKGNHLADKVPGAPLIFGRKKAMERIQQEANQKANRVFLDEYLRYRRQGKITTPLRVGSPEEIKRELRKVMG